MHSLHARIALGVVPVSLLVFHAELLAEDGDDVAHKLLGAVGAEVLGDAVHESHASQQRLRDEFRSPIFEELEHDVAAVQLEDR